MRKFTYINCPICGKEFQSLGYASHRAMHRRERERAKKLQQPPVINQVCHICGGENGTHTPDCTCYIYGIQTRGQTCL